VPPAVAPAAGAPAAPTMRSYIGATPRRGIAVLGRSIQGHRRYFSEVSEQFVAGKIYPKIQVARSGNV